MLFQRMKELKLTQKALAEIIGAGLDQSAICKILKGKQKPTLIQALRIEDELGIPVRYWGTVANDNEQHSQKEDLRE